MWDFLSKNCGIFSIEGGTKLWDFQHRGGDFCPLTSGHTGVYEIKSWSNAFKQMKVALQSEDPLVVYKCWLFVAMSLMQQKQLNQAKKIIKTVFVNVKSNHDNDDKNLIAMCKGIWARLQHAWTLEIKTNPMT